VHGKSDQHTTLPRHYCTCQAHHFEVVCKSEAPYVSLCRRLLCGWWWAMVMVMRWWWWDWQDHPWVRLSLHPDPCTPAPQTHRSNARRASASTS